jgi:hypothetical protein
MLFYNIYVIKADKVLLILYGIFLYLIIENYCLRIQLISAGEYRDIFLMKSVIYD